MPEFDKNLKPILLNEDSNPLNLPNPSVPTPNNYGSLGGRRDGGGNDDMVRQFFGNGPIISPMLPTVSAKELYDNRRYGKYSARIQNIEDQKAYAQSAWDQAANGILKGANLAATTVAGGFGTLVGAAKAVLPGGKLSDIWDNEVTRSLQEWNDEVDQTYLPNYYTDKQKNASWYSPDNWFSANWLFDKLVKNSGFAVGAMLGGNIANAGLLRAGSFLGRVSAGGAVAAESSQAFKLFTPLLRNMSRAFSAGKNKETAAILEKELSSIADLTSTASRIGELSKQTNAFARFSDAGRRSAVSLYSAAGESSFEALSTANQFRDNLIEKYKENHFGEEPEGEELEKINQAAEKIGKTSFLGNMALLTVTEFQQLPYLLGSSYNASRQAANSLAGRVDDVLMKDSKYLAAPKSTTRFGKLYDKVAGVGRYVFDLKEAAQEIGQYALQVGTQNYFNKAFQTNNADAWVDGFLYGFIGKDEKGEGVGALVSDEGIESGILGGITGGLMQARGTYLESRSKTANTQIFLDQLNGAPSFKKAFVDRKNAINRGVILQEQQQNAVLNGDELEAKDLGYDSMHNYLAPRVKYGRYDMVKDEIQDMRLQASTDEGFSVLQEQGLAGIGDDKLSFIEKLNEFERSADYVNELYKSLTLRYSGILDSDGKRKYSSNIIDKMVYAAGKIANYDVRIPAENLKLTAAGVTNIPEILESIIKDFQPNKVAVEGALKQINDMVNLLSEDRDSLKSSLSSLIEMSLRRKLFMDEYDAIKAKPEDFDETPEYAYGETEELPITVKQIGVPEGKKRKKELEKKLEVGREYSLKQPLLRQNNNLIFGPKMRVMSQTLGGEFEVLMPDGQVRFISPEDFKQYEVSEYNPITEQLSKIMDESIDSVLKRKKYDALEKPVENKLNYINSLNNRELIDDVEKEFKKRSSTYLKDLADSAAKSDRMKKYKDQLKKTQEEIEKMSSGIPTRDDESDLAISEDFWEDMRKEATRLFTSTTSISEDWDASNLPPHAVRFIEFANNVKKFKKKFNLKVMLVSSIQENLLGLDGLTALSFKEGGDASLIVNTKEQFDALSDEKKKEVIMNGFVGAVMIKVDGSGKKTFIDKDGKSIGVVGEKDAAGNVKKIDMNKVVFSTMPAVNLYWSNDNPRYRTNQKELATQYAAAWQTYREGLFKGNPNNFFDFDFVVSKGIPRINKKVSPRKKNFVGSVLIDNDQLNKERFVIVSKTGTIAHEDGNNYKFAPGRPAFKNADDLAYLNNNKFSRDRARAIFGVLKAFSEGLNTQIANNEKISVPQKYYEFLTSVLYWNTKGGASANKIYIDDDNLLHIGKKDADGNIVESKYDLANLSKFESEIISDLMNSYHNVNDKTLDGGLSKTFTDYYIDNAGVLKERVWSNYQSYLLSSINPDGSNRSIEDVPLYTNIEIPSTGVPYPFSQKYLSLLGMDLRVAQKEKKEDVSNLPKVGEYVVDGKTVNKYHIKAVNDDIEFTAMMLPDGSISVKLAENSAKNVETVKKILGDKNLVETLKNTGKGNGLYDQVEAALDKSGITEQEERDRQHMLFIVPINIQIRLNEIKANEVSSEKPPATPTPPTEAPPAAPAKEEAPAEGVKFEFPEDSIDDDVPFRRVGVLGKKVETMSDAEVEYFKNFVAEKLPGIPYQFIENLIRINGTDEQAWGAFENGVAKIFKRAAKGTAFHEIMEGVWLGFLSPEQQNALLNEMRSKKGSFIDRASGRRLDYSDATDLQLKERIMDDAADYFDGKIPAKSITGKILQFFKAILEFFKHWIGKPSLKEQLFRDVYKGKYKSFIFPESKKSFAPQYSRIEQLTEQQANDFVQDMTARMFQMMFYNDKPIFEVESSMRDIDVFGSIKEVYRKAGFFNQITEKTFDQLVQRTKDYLRRFNIEFDEDSVMSINDEERNKNDYSPDAFSMNFKRSSPYAVKLLLSSLVKTKRTSGPMGSLLNLPEVDRDQSSIRGMSLVPYGKTFTTLINKLSNVRDVPTFINKLYELAKENPDYVRLFVRLGGTVSNEGGSTYIHPTIDFSSFNDHKWRLFINFYMVFTKQKPDGFVQFLDEGKVYRASANQASVLEQIATEWRENMKLLSESPDSIVKLDVDKNIYKVDKDAETWKKINVGTPSSMVEFLSSIGIDFPMTAYNRLNSTHIKEFADAVSGIKTSLNKSDVLMSLKANDFDMSGRVKTLAKLYAYSTSPDEDSTFFNNMGKRQQSFTESNYVSYYEYVFNNVETLEELKRALPQLNDVFSRNAILLKPGGPLFDEDGIRRKNVPLKVQYILGDRDVNRREGTSIAKLDIGSRNALEINQNLSGSYYVLIPGDGSTEWMMNLGNTIKFNEFAEDEGNAAFERIYGIFHDYLKDEIYLARDAAYREKLNYTGKRADQLRFFNDILSEGLKEDIKILIDKPDLTDEEIDNFIDANRDAINASVKSMIENTVTKTKKTLVSNRQILPTKRKTDTGEFTYTFKSLEDDLVKSLGLNKRNLKESDINNILTYANANYIINNIEYHKVFFGDPYQFQVKTKNGKVIQDILKRIKSFLSPRRVTFNTDEFNNWYNVEYNKVTALTGQVIDLTEDDFGHHNFKPYLKTFTAKDVNIVGSLASLIPAYAKTNEADASSWLMPNAYRDVKIRNGQWPKEAEEWYQWHMAYTRRMLNEKGRYSYRGNAALMQNDIRITETPMPEYTLDVLKPIVTGNKFMEQKFNMVLDKFSQVPLVYHAIEDTNLEELFIKMFEEKYDYVVVESGRKEGVEGLHPIYNGNGSFNDNAFNNTVLVPWEAYGIQVENSYDKEKQQTLGSQLTKEATLDLYSNAEPIGDTPERKEVVRKAVSRNNEALKELIKNGYNEVLIKLGIQDLGDGFTITDKSKASETLRSEMLKREISENGIDTISLNPLTNDFEVMFEASVNYKQIKDILYSIVDKSIASPKVNGFSGVQISATGWENAKEGRSLVQKVVKNGVTSYKKITRKEYESLSNEEKQNVSLTSDRLKFYEDEDGKRHCEVLLPNWFKNKLKNAKYKTDEEILKYLNETPEGKKILMGVGFRIPTQALNSVEVFKVAGFLPSYMGRSVVVPSEITTKAGSDFDIDKLNMYLKNVYVDKKGDIKLVPFFGFGEQALEKMRKFVAEEAPADGYLSAEDYYKQSLENEYYDSLEEVLTLPENFSRLVAPNTSKDLEELADDIDRLTGEFDNNPKNTMIDRNQLTELRHVFISAKQWIGRVALSITNHSLSQRVATYVRDRDFSMVLPHNTMTVEDREVVSLSGSKDQTGKFISDILSMFANGCVDVVKDPYIMKIITSDRLVGTFMFLVRAGVPVKTIGLFMNQPIIREYVRMLDGENISSFATGQQTLVKRIKGAFKTNLSLLKSASINASEESLSSNISEYYEKEGFSDAKNAEQHKILDEFLEYFEVAQDLFGVTMSVNYDTTKFSNADELYRKQLLTELNNKENVISSPSKIMEASHLGVEAKALDRAMMAFQVLLIFNKPEFREIIKNVIKEYASDKYLSPEKFSKISEKLSASFLDYILQTKMNILDWRSLTVDSDSVANRIEKAKKENPNVKILQELIMRSSDVPGGAKTVSLKVNTKDSYDENLYIGYMREMRDNPATRDLYNDLVKLIIVQGTYYSPVSIRNILPLEDYSALVSPIIKTLVTDEDVKAFATNKMFQRNNWKDETIVPSIVPKYDIDKDEDYFVGLDEFDMDVFKYPTSAFPAVEELGLVEGQRSLMLVHPKSKGAANSVVTVPRIVQRNGEMIDFIHNTTVSKSEYGKRKASGDTSIKDIYGYERVEYRDGIPFLTADGYYVYKAINLLGDGMFATENKIFPSESVYNNNTIKIRQELLNDDIIEYFESEYGEVQSPNFASYVEDIVFSAENIEKIEQGLKTTTVRAPYNAERIGIPVGQSRKMQIGNKEYNVTNLGLMSVNQAGGKNRMVKSEALPTKRDGKNVYPVESEGITYYAMYSQTVSWLNGTGNDLYVYSIAPVSPAQKQPLYTFVEPVSKKEETGEIKFTDVGRTEVLYDRKEKRFVYRNKEGKELTYLQAAKVARKITPNYFKTWYKEMATREQKEMFDSILNELKALGNEALNFQYEDNIELFLMRQIKGVKFTPIIMKDLTDVSAKVWSAERSEGGIPVDVFVTDYLGVGSDDRFSEMNQAGFRQYDEQDVINMIKEIIGMYPRGISNNDIKKKEKDNGVTLKMESLEKDFLNETGLDLLMSFETFENLKDEKEFSEYLRQTQVQGVAEGVAEGEEVPQMTLSKDGKTYNITDVNSLMLRDLGYTDEETRIILSAIQNTYPQKDIFKC